MAIDIAQRERHYRPSQEESYALRAADVNRRISEEVVFTDWVVLPSFPGTSSSGTALPNAVHPMLTGASHSASGPCVVSQEEMDREVQEHERSGRAEQVA